MTSPRPGTNGDAGQRWRDRAHSWRRPEDGGFDAARYGVAPIADDNTAKAFVQQHHYSASYPAARLRYGLHDLEADEQLVGVGVLSVPASRKVLTNVFPRLAAYDESLELGRFVLLDAVPANAESWFLAQMFRLAAAEGLRGVVSFSDPLPRYATDEDGEPRLVMPGHVGTIYKATNATYTGRGTVRTLTMLRDGTVYSDRAKQKVRDQGKGHEYAELILIERGATPMRAGELPAAWLARALEEAGAHQVRHRGNHRYAFRLGTNRAERGRVLVDMDALPYPQRPDTLDLAA
jgi:hypothetical protein